MKTLLLLNDKPADSEWLLQDTVTVTGQMPKPVAACNCDRWGHPCPGCASNVQVRAEVPISLLIEKGDKPRNT